MVWNLEGGIQFSSTFQMELSLRLDVVMIREEGMKAWALV